MSGENKSKNEEKNMSENKINNSKKKTSNKSIEESIVDTNSKIKLVNIEDLEGKFLLVKVGTESNPATPEQISQVEKNLIKLFEENDINCVTYVTHHAVDMKIIK